MKRGFELPPTGGKPPGEKQKTAFNGTDIKFAPPYPENCRSRAAAGTVTVQFDISPEGRPVYIRIIETADRCFNRTVINTVPSGNTPPPQGAAVLSPVMRVVEIIRFELQD